MFLRWVPATVATALLSATIVAQLDTPATADPFAIVSCKTSAACDGGANTGPGKGVSGTSANNVGVFGSSAKTYGVMGKSNAIAGVYGLSPDKIGVFAETQNGYTAMSAISEQASGGAALYNAVASIKGNGATGIYAYSTQHVGIAAENDTNSYFTLFAQADSSGGYPFEAENVQTGGSFYVDPNGNGFFSGTVTHTLRTNGGPRVGAFSAEATRAQLEDVGTGRLAFGRGVVRFDASFARAIDPRAEYQVFLTPGGDNRGLYVTSKSPNGFEVRESQGGHATIPFDYRIVAKPIGASSQRLPELRSPFAMPAASTQGH